MLRLVRAHRPSIGHSEVYLHLTSGARSRLTNRTYGAPSADAPIAVAVDVGRPHLRAARGRVDAIDS
jgi:hypothetical protein